MRVLYISTIGFFISAAGFVFFGNVEFFRPRSSFVNNEAIVAQKNVGAPAAIAKQRRNAASKSWALSTVSNSGDDQFYPEPVVPSPIISGVKTVDKATAAPGEVLTYTVTITNTGTAAGTDLDFSDNIDANTTLVPNSIQASPIAANDQYASLGNVGIAVPIANGILANDYLGINPAAAFVAVTNAATTGGGTISIAVDGSFTYAPAPGFVGDDTYVYTLTNLAGSSNGTITISVAGITWFINNTYSGTVADGRLATPFKSINDFQAVNDGVGSHPSNGHFIFVYESATNYIGNLSLRDGQKLIGQDATTTLPTITGFTTPPFSSPSLPVLNSGNGTFVQLTGTVASTPVITLNGGAAGAYIIRGLRIGDKPADATAAGIAGTNFGTLTATELSISGTGQALLLSTGTVNGTFASVSSTSGASGISLTTINGAITISSGSLANNATGLNLNAGTASLTYDGTITNSSANLVNIQSKTGGTVDLNGAISSGAGARGISLTNNTGTTIRFDGGLSLNTGVNNAFNASGGGTLNITQDNSTIINTITTTTGFGLQITNTTIGANGVSFRSISVNGSTSSGIGLNNTGAGAFTVTGIGTTAASGGTIQNVSLRGIEIISAQNISLNNIQLTNANTTDGGGAGICDEINNNGCNGAVYLKDVNTVALTQVNITTTLEQGMNMNNVSGLTMSNCTVQGNGDAAEEGALKIRNLLGTSSITNCIFKNSAYRVAHIINTTGNVHLAISGSTFINDASNLSLIKQDCFEMRTQSAATATLLISNSTFKRAGTKGIQVFAENTSVINMAITGSSIDRDGQLMAGVEVGSDQTAVMNANVDNNSLIAGNREVPLNVYSGSTSTMQATARNNTSIQGGNDPNLNSFATLRGYADQQSNSKILFTDNVVTNTDELGIQVASAGVGSGGSISGRVGNNTVNSNNIAGNTTLAGIQLTSFSSGAGANTNCSYVNGNSVTVLAGTPVLRVSTVSATSTLQLQGPASASTAALWTVNSNTPASPPALVTVQQVLGSTITNGGAFICPLPTNTVLPTLNVAARPQEEILLTTEDAFAKDQVSKAEEKEVVNVSSVSDGIETSPVITSKEQLTESSLQILSGENVSVTGITLPENKTLTIKFQVTVNNPFPEDVCTVSNQGSISGTNFTSLLTDNDANSGNGINPTVTTIPVAPSITICQSNINVNTDAGLCTSTQAFSVTAKGCPAPTITYTIQNTVTTITSPYAFPVGTTTIDVTATNGVGAAATCSFTVTVTAPVPVVSAVSVPSNGSYKLGTNLDFTVTFNTAVNVTGTPLLPLTIGVQSRNASYVSGSGTSSLLFRYTVAATDLDNNGIAIGSAINANGGTLKNSCNTDAVLTLNNVGSTTGVLVDGVVPTVTINQAAGQADPGSGTTINFTVVFSESVSDFTNTDVTLGGTALATTAVVTQVAPNNGTTYNVAVSGMTVDGTVTASIGAGVASDAAGNLNTASTSSDNTVSWVADQAPYVVSINRQTPSAQLTNATSVTFRVIFSEDVTGVNASDFTLTTTGTVTGSVNTVTPVDEKTYDLNVNTISGNGTLRLDLKNSGTGIKDKDGTTFDDIAGGFTSGQIYTIDQLAPVINNCPATDPGFSTGSNCLATVTWTVPTANDNVDGALTYSGHTGPNPGDNLGVGSSAVTYTFTDAAGNQNVCSFTVNVVDTQDPAFTTQLSANPLVIWPPDHKMKKITLTYAATDNCTAANAITYTYNVTSNEQQHGTGDGDKSPDWEVINGELYVRAERGNGKDARVYTVTVTATDASGNSAISNPVEIRIAHNITSPLSGSSFRIGSTVNFTGVFWDKPGNKHTATWSIDGTTIKGIVTEPSGTKNGKVTGSYKFTTAGIYKLQMNITDQNRVTSFCNTNEDLEAIVVIYDPNGGFTYGGGYFESPAGALKSDLTATGKASYGYSVNYFKGATYPKGETQFDFKVGDFEYNALNYEYLSVAGYKAVIRGSGRIIGGQSGIYFNTYVIDGALDGTGIDKVRMKIFNKNTGHVYYDNESGGDADDPKTPVGLNSSIVIGGVNNAIITTGTLKEINSNEVIAPNLELKTYPNPSHSNFKIVITSTNSNDKVVLKVMDILGRVIEQKVADPNQVISLGGPYLPGIYIVQAVQGKLRKEVRLNKIPY